MQVSSMTYIRLLSLCFFLAGCQTLPKPPQQVVDYPISFEAAVTAVTHQLLGTLAKQQAGNQLIIVLDPFVDANSGDVLEISRSIEEDMIAEGKKYYPSYILDRLTPALLRRAQYVLNGTINLRDYQLSTESATDKYYQLSASLVDLKTGVVIAHAMSWIADADLNYVRTPLYRNSPTFFKDKRVQSQIETAETHEGKSADDEYYSSLDTNALLVEAETAYENTNYTKAHYLFQKAAARSDGQVMKTYLGLYETTRKTEKENVANQEAAFTKLLALSIQETNSLNIRFLFEVNSIEFINNNSIRQQYAEWLRMISRFLQKNSYCFQVVGHSSKTGKADYNLKLSVERAEHVRQLLAVELPSLATQSKAIGKGFSENLVGSGTDDAQDAIDRRVELSIVNCQDFKVTP
ncbi:outer membrane protein/peptidoglycan-associated (lipo)protein [Beggiatoa alba B18LD]|uniref:Outer membrane protein/peptidoglycan-associated (Lipo)protein n=2 Tax=Beggiatoa alba TaxID=1022 RepID=I3CJF0_9GAMM|nr:outer membrane protein/peptidoglycan-associated (lipo)protein [Beggiatoa alba B18LD]